MEKCSGFSRTIFIVAWDSGDRCGIGTISQLSANSGLHPNVTCLYSFQAKVMERKLDNPECTLHAMGVSLFANGQYQGKDLKSPSFEPYCLLVADNKSFVLNQNGGVVGCVLL